MSKNTAAVVESAEVEATETKATRTRSALSRARHAVTGIDKRIAKTQAYLEYMLNERPALVAERDRLEALEPAPVPVDPEVLLKKARAAQAKAERLLAEVKAEGLDLDTDEA